MNTLICTQHMVIVINKCDLVPTWVTRRWVKLLSADFPTLAFHANINNSFGKGALISLLRQFGKLHAVSFNFGVLIYIHVHKYLFTSLIKIMNEYCTIVPLII